MTSLSSRERRAIAFGVVTIGTALAVVRGIPALRAWQTHVAATAVQLESEVARARTSAQRAQATSDSLIARRKRLRDIGRQLLHGGTPAMAAATLASMVTTAATESNVNIGMVQVHADTASSSTFSPVTVHAEGTGDIIGVMSLLKSLETDSTLLWIRDVSISQPEPAAPPERFEALRLELTVQGLVLRAR